MLPDLSILLRNSPFVRVCYRLATLVPTKQSTATKQRHAKTMLPDWTTKSVHYYDSRLSACAYVRIYIMQGGGGRRLRRHFPLSLQRSACMSACAPRNATKAKATPAAPRRDVCQRSACKVYVCRVSASPFLPNGSR